MGVIVARTIETKPFTYEGASAIADAIFINVVAVLAAINRITTKKLQFANITIHRWMVMIAGAAGGSRHNIDGTSVPIVAERIAVEIAASAKVAVLVHMSIDGMLINGDGMEVELIARGEMADFDLFLGRKTTTSDIGSDSIDVTPEALAVVLKAKIVELVRRSCFAIPSSGFRGEEGDEDEKRRR
jgi:hypothetical protein